jgi:hypothetical protein
MQTGVHTVDLKGIGHPCPLDSSISPSIDLNRLSHPHWKIPRRPPPALGPRHCTDNSELSLDPERQNEVVAPCEGSSPESPILAQSTPDSPVLNALPLLPFDEEEADGSDLPAEFLLHSLPSVPARDGEELPAVDTAVDAAIGGAEGPLAIETAESIPAMDAADAPPVIGSAESPLAIETTDSIPAMDGANASPEIGSADAPLAIDGAQSLLAVDNADAPRPIGSAESPLTIEIAESIPAMDSANASPEIGGADATLAVDGSESSVMDSANASPEIGGADAPLAIDGAESLLAVDNANAPPGIGSAESPLAVDGDELTPTIGSAVQRDSSDHPDFDILSDSADESPPCDSPLPDGCLGQLGWEVSLQTLLAEYAVSIVEDLPPDCFAKFHADGFAWLSLLDVPRDVDLAYLNAMAETQSVHVFVRCPEVPFFFTETNQFRELLDGANPSIFNSYCRSQPSETLRRVFHSPSEYAGSEFAAILLTLPGLRLLCRETPHCDAYRRLLSQQALQWGSFSVLEVVCEVGEIIAWKYVGEGSRILVCVNPSTEEARARISCSDGPEPTDADVVRVQKCLTDTVVMCDAQELRVRGLLVILRPSEAQIFQY